MGCQQGWLLFWNCLTGGNCASSTPLSPPGRWSEWMMAGELWRWKLFLDTVGCHQHSNGRIAHAC